MRPARPAQPIDRAHLHAGRVRYVVERIEYACAELLLRLAVHVSVEPLATSAPTLLVERGEVELCYSPILACTTRTPHVDALCSNDDGDWRWRGTFAVPLDVAGDRSAEFALRLRDDVILSLPAPVHGGLPSRDVLASRGRPRKRQARLWRGALALIVTGQLLVGPGVAPVRALAAGAVDSGGEGSGEPTPAPSGGESSEAPSSPAPTVEGEGTTPTTPGPEATPPPEQHEQTTEEGTKHAEPPAGPTGEAGPETPAQPATAPAATPPASAPGSVAAATAGTAPTSVQAAPRGGASSTRELNLPQARRIRRGSARRVHGAQPRHAPASHSAEAQDKQPSAFSIEAGALAPQIAELTGLLGGVEEGPPAYLVPIYKAAGHRYHVPWRVLAAINAIETDYGRNLSVSSAGAVGWMQFMPETWARWGVDADHDGIKNPYSPQDAIFAAARYLRASGAEGDLAGAIFAYNHAQWYVTDVLLRAHLLANAASFADLQDGYALPLEKRYLRTLGRTDDGVDIETAPDGALVYSMTPGVVTAVASDPSGFGPNYPVVRASAGSLQGRSIYYGHVAASLVHPGEIVAAGQPIAIMGHTGDAASLGHGHIEIGFSDEGGDPLNHHGAGAWTPAGDIMRAFLVGLSGSFGVQNE